MTHTHTHNSLQGKLKSDMFTTNTMSCMRVDCKRICLKIKGVDSNDSLGTVFLPHFKNMPAMWTGDSKFPFGVNVSVNGCWSTARILWLTSNQSSVGKPWRFGFFSHDAASIMHENSLIFSVHFYFGRLLLYVNTKLCFWLHWIPFVLRDSVCLCSTMYASWYD